MKSEDSSIASAIRELAAATREHADAVDGVARSLQRINETLGGDASGGHLDVFMKDCLGTPLEAIASGIESLVDAVRDTGRWKDNDDDV